MVSEDPEGSQGVCWRASEVDEREQGAREVWVHLAMVMSRSDFEATSDEQVADILTESFPRGKDVYFKDKLGVVSNTFLGKREC
jgi:hypothetical protein